MRGLQDRVFLVAGASRGIGASVAQRLAAEGAKVVVADIDGAGAEKVAAELVAEGGEAVSVQYDQSDEGSVQAMVRSAVDAFGTLDGVHANAADVSGETQAEDRDVSRMTQETWEHVLRTNLIGYAVLIREVLPILRTNGGAIVCTTSDAAEMGQRALPAYAASKAGVEALVRHTASRWGRDDIRVNAVSPGLILTEAARERADEGYIDKTLAATRSHRLGEPQDVASTVVFLLSDDASWVNGQTWSVNGGLIFRG